MIIYTGKISGVGIVKDSEIVCIKVLKLFTFFIGRDIVYVNKGNGIVVFFIDNETVYIKKKSEGV